MEDTAQPIEAAETEAVSTDPIADAMAAFKAHLGQEAPTERARDEKGRFAPTEQEIEAEADGEPDAEVESQEIENEAEEAADEAQPTEADLPNSWPSEQADLWKTLPPEAQAFIAEREGQRDAAVNAKFQEAANLRKAHEAEINEAHTNRARYAEAVDLVLSLVKPQPPSLTMLDINSSDYDPDAYHLRKGQYEETVAFLNSHVHQRQTIAAQEEQRRFQTLNEAGKAAFVANVPDATDPAKAPAVFQGLIDYAVSQGAPSEMFAEPTTALEWNFIWKAQQYDKLQEAKAKVKTDPKPEPRKATPAVRPGVTTPRSAAQHQQRKAAFDRLAKSGSIQDGAAALKHLLGKVS